METLPTYAKQKVDQQHFAELRKQVNKTVSELGKSRMLFVKIKAMLIPTIYFAFYIISLFQHKHLLLFFLLHIGMGIIMVLMFINTIHEAAHNTLFHSKKLNRLYLFLFDVLGANSYIWKVRHTRLHHNFSNVAGWDSDIQQSGMLKIFPDNETKSLHKYQHLLIFLLYPLYLINWLFIRDFKDFFSRSQLVHKICNINLIEYFKLIFFKSLFLFYIVIVPWLFFNFSLEQTIMAMFCMLITASVFALIILLPPHANTANHFPVVHKSLLPDSWLMHQILTTNDVSTSNWFTKFIMANFNYHISHHLFPNISYAYAKEVTMVIKNFAFKNNLPYKSYSLGKALKNHYLLVKRNGMDKDFFEEDM